MLDGWLDTLLGYDFSITHCPGTLNVLPDALSRLFPDSLRLPRQRSDDPIRLLKLDCSDIADWSKSLQRRTDDCLGSEHWARLRAARVLPLDRDAWKLNPAIFDYLHTSSHGKFDIELFSSKDSNHLDDYCVDPAKYKEGDKGRPDTFSTTLGTKRFYANPPWSLIPKTANYLRSQHAQGCLVTPLYAGAPWFKDLLKNSCHQPLLLPPHKDTFLPLSTDHKRGLGAPPWGLTVVWFLDFKKSPPENKFSPDFKDWPTLDVDELLKSNPPTNPQPKLSAEHSAELFGFTLVPEDDRQDALSERHHFGHEGADGLVNKLLADRLWWKSMHKDAANHVLHCLPCQRHNIHAHGFQPLKSLEAQEPMRQVCIDLKTDLPSSLGCNHILIVIDVHSRFVWLRPLPDKTSTVVAKALLEIIRDFGPFSIYTSDNGSEFHNSLTEELSRLLNFELRFTSPYNPRANGLAERTVRSMMDIIKKQLNGDSPSWASLLIGTQLSLNNRIAAAHGSRPFSVMFGRSINPLIDYSQLEASKEPTTEQLSKDISQRMKLATEAVFPAIADRSSKAAEQRQKRHDTSHTINKTDFPIGTKVMLLNKSRKDKLEVSYEGPYIIAAHHKGGSYSLLDSTNPPVLLPRNVPHGHLKPIGANVPFGESYVVENVLRHEGTQATRRYLVRWKGRPAAEDSWLSPALFDDEDTIRRYWKRLGRPNPDSAEPTAIDWSPSKEAHQDDAQAKANEQTTQVSKLPEPPVKTAEPETKSLRDYSEGDPTLLLREGESYQNTVPTISKVLRRRFLLLKWEDGRYERMSITKWTGGTGHNCSIRGQDGKERFQRLDQHLHTTPTAASPPGSWCLIRTSTDTRGQVPPVKNHPSRKPVATKVPPTKVTPTKVPPD
jgi:hypothetical protein